MSMDVDAPQSWGGVLIVFGAALLVLVALFTTGVGPVLLGAIVIAVMVYLLWVVGGRLNDRIRHGKPILRGGMHDTGGDGGDADGD